MESNNNSLLTESMNLIIWVVASLVQQISQQAIAALVFCHQKAMTSTPDNGTTLCHRHNFSYPKYIIITDSFQHRLFPG